jgi:hypothetical protein
MKTISGATPAKHLRGGQRDVLGDPPVVGLGLPYRGHAEAEEAGVSAGEIVRAVGEVEEVVPEDLAEPVILPPHRGASDDQDGIDPRIAQHCASTA